MNCDQVFDILTRGPFPTGTSCDAPVEAHLNECVECRRLAEALRPALELFQEAVDPEESCDLPGYWCAPSHGRTSVSYASEVESRKRLPSIGGSAVLAGHTAVGTAWRMAAMLAVGVALGSLVGARWVLDDSAWSPFATGVAPYATTDEEPLPNIAERMQLAALPAACFGQRPNAPPRHRHEQLLAGAELAKLSCCSGCHNSDSPTVPATATTNVVQSCQLCHAGRP